MAKMILGQFPVLFNPNNFFMNNYSSEVKAGPYQLITFFILMENVQ